MANGAQQKQSGIPPWVWIGCGCLGAIGLVVAVIVGAGVWGINKAVEFGEAMEDPVKREEKALEVLGADELPEGYHAVIALEIPFLFEMAMLSDVPPDENGQPGDGAQRGFFFLNLLRLGDDEAGIRDFFDGKSEDLSAIGDDTNVDLDLEERVASGAIERDADTLKWVSHRGRVRNMAQDLPEDPGEGEAANKGLVTLFLMDCGDERGRIGIWYGRDPNPEAPPAELELAGTVGDSASIETFMAPIRPCG